MTHRWGRGIAPRGNERRPSVIELGVAARFMAPRAQKPFSSVSGARNALEAPEDAGAGFRASSAASAAGTPKNRGQGR
jgi:hypothetical protein